MRDFKSWVKGILLKDNNVGPNAVGDLSASLGANDNGAVYNYQNILRVWLSNSEHQILTNDQTQTITNKTIDADNNTVSNLETDNLKAGVLNIDPALAGATDTQIPSALAAKTYVDNEIGALTMADIAYDNASSGLTATDGQAAIDEIDVDVDDLNTLSGVAKNAQDLGTFTGTTISDNTTIKNAVQELETAHEAHLNDAVDAHDASAISYNNATSGLTATEAQSAIDELDGRLDTAETNIANKVDKVVSTDNAVTRFDGALGSVQNSTVLLSDTGTFSQVNAIDINGTTPPHINGSAGSSLVISKSPTSIALLNTGNINITADVVDFSRSVSISRQETLDSSTNNSTGSNASISLTHPTISLIGVGLVSIANFTNLYTPTGNARHVIINNTGGDVTILNSASIITGTNNDLVLKDDSAIIIYVNSSNVAQVIGGTGADTGSGEFNYIANSGEEGNTTGWTVYANTTLGNTIGSVPAPDNFGGTPSGNLTFTSNTTTPLIGNNDFKLSKTANNVQGEGVYYQFSAEKAHLTLKMFCRMYADLSALNDNDLSVWLVSSSDNFSADFNVISANNPQVLVSKIIAKQFQLDASDVSYRLCIHYSSTDTVAKDAYFDDVFLGPKDVATSASLSDWTNFPSVAAGTMITSTGTSPSYGTVTNNIARYRRVGSNLEIEWDFLQTSIGSTGTGIYLFNLPSGFKIDTSVKPIDTTVTVGDNTADAKSTVGTANFGFSNGVGESFADGALIPYSDTQLKILIKYTSANNQTDTDYWGNIYRFGDSSDPLWMSIRASIPIQGWSSNAVSSEDLGNRNITVDAAGNNGAAITANVTNINWTLQNQSVSAWNGTQFTAPEYGSYSFNGVVLANAASVLILFMYKNGVYYRTISDQTTANDRAAFSLTVPLNKGDVISFRSQQSFTLLNLTDSHFLNINKLASPQTVLETETVAARYTSNSGQAIGTNFVSPTDLIFEDLFEDSHNAYNISNGEYTVPISGSYSISVTFKTDVETWALGNAPGIFIDVNGSLVYNSFERIQAAITTSFQLKLSIASIKLNKGDVLKIRAASDVATNMSTDTIQNLFSIVRNK